MTNSWDHDHIVHIGNVTETPVDPASDANVWRKRIEPWLSAVFQAEHLSLVNAGVNSGHGAGVKRGHLLMPDTVLPVVPAIHRRDPRCFV